MYTYFIYSIAFYNINKLILHICAHILTHRHTHVNGIIPSYIANIIILLFKGGHSLKIKIYLFICTS